MKKCQIEHDLLFDIGYLLTRFYEPMMEKEPERFKTVFDGVSKKLSQITKRKAYIRACDKRLTPEERQKAMAEYISMKAAAEREIPP